MSTFTISFLLVHTPLAGEHWMYYFQKEGINGTQANIWYVPLYLTPSDWISELMYVHI